jgi:hypothetical protein
MEFIDDKDFLIVRKNLNIFSVVILLLAFTTADVGILSLFGIKVEMNGQKVYIALFVGYIYFIWRYLTKLPLISGFWNDFTTYYMQSYGGNRMNKTFYKYRNQFISDPPGGMKLLEKDPSARLLKIDAVRLAGNRIRQLRIIATFYITRADGGQNMSMYHDILVSKTTFYSKFVRFCIRYDKFGDYIVPIVLVLVNMLFFIFKSEWQGSMQTLFVKSN